MKKTVREILVKLVFDEEWEEYVDEHVDIVIEDSGIECALKDGITMEVMSDNMFDDRRIDKNMQARMANLCMAAVPWAEVRGILTREAVERKPQGDRIWPQRTPRIGSELRLSVFFALRQTKRELRPGRG